MIVQFVGNRQVVEGGDGGQWRERRGAGARDAAAQGLQGKDAVRAEEGVPLPLKPISDSDRIGYRDIPTDLLCPHMAQVSSLGPGLFVRESTEAI